MQLLHPSRCGCHVLRLRLRFEDRIHGAGMTDKGPATGAAQCCLRGSLGLPFRLPLPGLFSFRLLHTICTRRAIAGLSQPAKHSIDGIAQPLRHQPAHDLGDTSTESDAAPLDIVLCRVVVGRDVLGAITRQGVDELVTAGEVIAAIMEVYAVAVPRQGDMEA